LRDYKWPAEAWEVLAKEEPYFFIEWLDPSTAKLLSDESKSSLALLRMDYFIAKTSYEPHYSQFLSLPDTVNELQKKFAVQVEDVERLSLNAGGAVLSSIVALHNRQLERYPTITGYFWQSYDVINNKGKRSVIDNVEGVERDGGEFIWSLPNGLQGYYLANAKGEQLSIVPAGIAQDSKTPFQDKQVYVARSCVLCHATGINTFSDVISKLIRGRQIQLKSYNHDRALSLEEFYLSDLGEKIVQDQEIYQRAVRRCNGSDVDDNAARYTNVVFAYEQQKVNLETAAREVGISADKFRLVAEQVTNGTVKVLEAGEVVARDAWENSFEVVARIVGEKK